jgi:hypothetical protein
MRSLRPTWAAAGALLLAAHCAPLPRAPSAPNLCRYRPRCTLTPIGSVGTGSQLLRAELLPAPAPSSDEERCQRREVWLARAAGSVLLLADCAEQWGADSQGPAQLVLQASRLFVQYEEFQSNDACERLEASIDLGTLALEQQRWRGVVASERCRAEQALSEVPLAGDGSAEQPLLVLHRE